MPLALFNAYLLRAAMKGSCDGSFWLNVSLKRCIFLFVRNVLVVGGICEYLFICLEIRFWTNRQGVSALMWLVVIESGGFLMEGGESVSWVRHIFIATILNLLKIIAITFLFYSCESALIAIHNKYYIF